MFIKCTKIFFFFDVWKYVSSFFDTKIVYNLHNSKCVSHTVYKKHRLFISHFLMQSDYKFQSIWIKKNVSLFFGKRRADERTNKSEKLNVAIKKCSWLWWIDLTQQQQNTINKPQMCKRLNANKINPNWLWFNQLNGMYVFICLVLFFLFISHSFDLRLV